MRPAPLQDPPCRWSATGLPGGRRTCAARLTGLGAGGPSIECQARPDRCRGLGVVGRVACWCGRRARAARRATTRPRSEGPAGETKSRRPRRQRDPGSGSSSGRRSTDRLGQWAGRRCLPCRRRAADEGAARAWRAPRGEALARGEVERQQLLGFRLVLQQRALKGRREPEDPPLSDYTFVATIRRPAYMLEKPFGSRTRHDLYVLHSCRTLDFQVLKRRNDLFRNTLYHIVPELEYSVKGRMEHGRVKFQFPESKTRLSELFITEVDYDAEIDAVSFKRSAPRPPHSPPPAVG